MNIAVATSIFAESRIKYDPFETIKFAEENKIPAIQFFIDEKKQGNLPEIDKIRDLCQKSAIKILCHSSKRIGSASHDTAHCKALATIFPHEADKKCIFHFDENADIDLMISDCEKLVNFGLVPCIENFYDDKTRHGLDANMEKYLAFFDIIKEKNIPVIPVIDFPRLFVEEFTNFHPIALAEQLIQKFAKQKMIIHAIDSVSPHQDDRNNWCVVGSEEGIVGWKDIFEYIKKQSVSVEYTVLEYENIDNIQESIQNLEKLYK
jgi:sugar phosphate isomerase/epimerase